VGGFLYFFLVRGGAIGEVRFGGGERGLGERGARGRGAGGGGAAHCFARLVRSRLSGRRGGVRAVLVRELLPLFARGAFFICLWKCRVCAAFPVSFRVFDVLHG
jgi:hypothetical protein